MEAEVDVESDPLGEGTFGVILPSKQDTQNVFKVMSYSKLTFPELKLSAKLEEFQKLHFD